MTGRVTDYTADLFGGEELFDLLDELRVARIDARVEALHALTAAVDEVLVEVPARRGAGRLGELGVERILLEVDLGEHREVDRVLVDAERRDFLVRARLLAAEIVRREAEHY